MKYKNLPLCFMVLLSGASLVACDNDPSSVTFTFNNLGDNVSIHSEHQEAYLKDSNYNSIGKYAAYASNEGYADASPVTISWDVKKAKEYEVLISESDNDWDNAFTIKTEEMKADFYNAKLNTKYYYKVNAVYKKVNFYSEVQSFTTSDSIIRNLHYEGIDNFRDLGAFKTSSGKSIKQGLIFRSGHFNKAKVNGLEPLVSDNEIDNIKKQLNIKTDVDLRKNMLIDGAIETSGITSSPIHVPNYQQLPMFYDGENILNHSDSEKNEINKNSIQGFFNLLSKEDNYPIVFHCVQGKDRTGCLAYLLESLLGVDEKDIMRDYLFTNFSNSVGSPCKESDISMRYGLTIKNYDGETLQDKAFKYLNEVIGVTQDNLERIRSILLG